jgi:hypothetical protein
VLKTATKCIRGCCSEAPEAVATRIKAFNRDIAPAILNPSRKNAAKIVISHIWKDNVGTKEGIAIPENLGFKTTVTAAKAIVNAIAFVFKTAPFHIIN